MTREEYLLTVAAEEAMEIAYQISKSNRFGLNEIGPDQNLSNRMQIRNELIDLISVLEMIDPNLIIVNLEDIQKKKDKVERYIQYSIKCGRII